LSWCCLAIDSRRVPETEVFRTYAWDVEMKYTEAAKTEQFQWGLLRGLLEAR
jgi:hypothetical protein